MTDIARDMLDGVRKLAPEITRRAQEMEAERRMPRDLVDKLKSIGVFRMLSPRSQGGLELELPAALEVFKELSKIDGSTGWTAIVAGIGSIFAPSLPREIYERTFRSGPDVVFAGSLQPAGKAEATDHGWRVTGRWPFASGCQHADWLLALCIMTKDGEPLRRSAGLEGAPLVRCLVLPAGEFQIEDTWHVAGLKGTGSHHIALTDKLVETASFFEIENTTSCIPGPLYSAFEQLVPVMHSAFAVGMAEGALDEIVALANAEVQQGRSGKRESEIFQSDLGRIAAEVSAARAYFDAQVTRVWQRALAGTLGDDGLLKEASMSATWIHAACAHAIDACYRLGGGSALYETSPLQRRMRDIHAGAQHASVHERHYIGAGKLLLSRSATAASASGQEAIGAPAPAAREVALAV